MSKQVKKDLPPAPKGVYYQDGSTTTRASKASDGVPAVPSAGGTHRAGKDPSNCDDALGNPERHHGAAPSDPKVVSGKGPAAAKKQVGTAGWN